MKKIQTQFGNLQITPVKYLSRSLYEQCNAIFLAQYRGGFRPVPYDFAVKYTELVLLQDGHNLVGFLLLFDWIKVGKLFNLQESGFNIWDPSRKAYLKQIELAWIHPRYRGNGLITEFYRYAISNMHCTHIHIDERRVVNRTDYWRNVGFTKFYLCTLGGGQPGLKLHVDSDDGNLHDLTRTNLFVQFHRSNLKINTPAQIGTRSNKLVEVM
jgi:hypothetical protein